MIGCFDTLPCMPKTSWQQGEPLDSESQVHLRSLIKERGESKTSELLGIPRVSLVRAAAGAGVRRVTAMAIKGALTNLDGKKKTG
jgi:hypothetical protein